MKPVKPKTMPKNIRRWLEATASHAVGRGITPLTTRNARSILAALEYERQRANKAEDVAIGALRDVHGIPEVKYSERHQREQTAAVVPPKKTGKAGTHARADGYDVRREKAKLPPCGSCQKRKRAEGLSVCEPCAKDIYGQARG
jgi:hypothetical protein